MKLQNLTVIFSIIVIPITLILSAYIQTQVDTANLQAYYDTKLLDATHDAVLAFQLNTLNNEYSTNSDSMRRDIKASINTFSSSLSKSMGFGTNLKSTILTYIPAMVFTLYDGYYIYSPDFNGQNDYEHLLKPYIYYSAKYISGGSYVIVNYTLDNFITVYGYVQGKGYIYNSGYIIDINRAETIGNQITRYHVDATKTGTIDTTLHENVVEFNENNERKQKVDYSAKEYYQKAYEFSVWLEDNNIYDIVRPVNAVRSDGEYYREVYSTVYNPNNEQVLKFSDTNAENIGTSSFNQHKIDIMRLSIQENLNSAMNSYSTHSQALNTTANFTMPKLTDEDWEKILTNINMVTFMQGIQIGTEMYNDYAIITSTNNKQYVSPDSLYFIDGSGNYHRINCPELADNNIVGYKSVDFQRRKSEDEMHYYYLHKEYGCYKCIVDALDETLNIENLSQNKKQAYYNALAREKNNLYKTIKKNMIDAKVLVIGDEGTRLANSTLAVALNSKFENVTYDYISEYSNDRIRKEGFKLVIFNQSAGNENSARINQLFAQGINVITIGTNYNSALDIIDAHQGYNNCVTNNIRKSTTINWFDNLPTNLSGFSGNGNVVNRFKEGTETIYTVNVNGQTYPGVGLYTSVDRTRWLHLQLNSNNSILPRMAEIVEYMLTKTSSISLPTDITYSNYTLPLTYNGINQYQPINTSINLHGRSNISMSTTIIAKSQIGKETKHSIISSGQDSGWKLFIDEQGHICAEIFINGIGYQTLKTSNSIIEGNKYNIICTYDNSIMKLYVNGELISSKNVSGAIIQRSDVPVIIGASPSAPGGIYKEYFNGEIKNVRVYSETLSPSQIQELWRRENKEYSIEE